MKYTKEEVKTLLDAGTHVLKVDDNKCYINLVKELYPKDLWLSRNFSFLFGETEYVKSVKGGNIWSRHYHPEGKIVIGISDMIDEWFTFKEVYTIPDKRPIISREAAETILNCRIV